MIPFNAQRQIDDLGFRVAWLEKVVTMNIQSFTAMLKNHPNATAEELRAAIDGVRQATEDQFKELQVSAAERMVAFAKPPSLVVLDYFRPAAADLLRRPTPLDRHGESARPVRLDD